MPAHALGHVGGGLWRWEGPREGTDQRSPASHFFLSRPLSPTTAGTPSSRANLRPDALSLTKALDPNLLRYAAVIRPSLAALKAAVGFPVAWAGECVAFAAHRSYPCCSREDMAMRHLFTEEIGDTLFAVAMAVAIGIGATNLAVQVGKERAALDAAAPAGAVSTTSHPIDPSVATRSTG